MDTYLQNNPYFRISFGQGRDISHTNSSKGQNIFHCDITFNHIIFNLILKKYSSLIETAKKNMKDEVEVLKNELKSANDEIKRLNANLESLNSLVASITQYGGSYQIDDC